MIVPDCGGGHTGIEGEGRKPRCVAAGRQPLFAPTGTAYAIAGTMSVSAFPIEVELFCDSVTRRGNA